ncbi:MAG: rhodanese-like domain-containing protein [Pseudomonadota bacterium]
MFFKGVFSSVNDLTAEEVRTYLAENPPDSFMLVDVRTPEEYKQAHLYGASLLPASELPERLSGLDPEKPLIVYCASGTRSRAAANLLRGQQFKKVFNLKGGIRAWQGVSASGPPDFGLGIFRDRDTPAQLTALAYGLEEGSRLFYLAMAESSLDKETKGLFESLAEVEDLHKDNLFGLYLSLTGEPVSREDFEAHVIRTTTLEGGFPIDDFLAEQRGKNNPPTHPLDLALSLEVQALDLYLRFLQKLDDEDNRQIISKIIRDEKKHLTHLGRMMGKKI